MLGEVIWVGPKICKNIYMLKLLKPPVAPLFGFALITGETLGPFPGEGPTTAAGVVFEDKWGGADPPLAAVKH